MNLIIDTNRYTDLYRGNAQVERALEESKEVNVPFVALAELRAGFLLGNKRAENEAILGDFLKKPGVRVLNPDEQATHVYAALFLQLRKQGTAIPTNDIWIAALEVQHGLALFTRDAHFDRLPQIPRVGLEEG